MMEEKRLKQKRAVAIISVILALALMGWLTWFLISSLDDNIRSPEDFKTYIDSFGVKGYLVAFGIQVLQVFVALIPGEVVEIGLGYAFGWFGGTLVCWLGVAVASSAVFLIVKKAGVKAVELFVDTEKINSLRFLNSEEKLKRTVFLLFFIPGTPKDLLTYFVGLTRMNLVQFLSISMLARLPSVFSSTLVGHFAGAEDYKVSIIIFVSTAIISLTGLFVYNKLLKQKHKELKERRRAKKEAKNSGAK